VQGPIQIRATSDRSDNDVTNGIGDPVSTTFSVIVSDGKLYSLEITSPVVAPNLPGITVNPISDDVTTDPGSLIPPNPDATLSLVVSALGTDRQGNPVLPGTAIRFGAVDEPVGAPGSANDNVVLLSGTDGNPQESGTLFTAPGGEFTTAGGGAGPGDALIVFGKAVNGNADLESAATVATVNGATSLNVSRAFNSNDTTGATVDYGAVLPYLIGRAQHGNISSPSTTNDIGVAHTTLNYTVNSVGNAVAIWAEGDGLDYATGGQRNVVDAGTLAYPGVAPATLIVSPQSISGNTSVAITACVTDALGIPLRGLQVGFLYTFTAGGNGSVDGTANTGTFSHLTGVDGCAVGVATTANVAGTATGGSAGTLTVSTAGQSVDIDITAPVVKGLTVKVIATEQTVHTYTVTIGSGAGGPSPPNQPTQCAVQGPTAAAGVVCGTFTFNEGASVSLTAGADDSAIPFVSWAGTPNTDCTTPTPNATAVMSDDVTCTATFGPIPGP
jgi:hypothetical protein